MKNRLTTIIALSMAAVTMLSSCQTSGQALAGLTGAAIGSNIGGAIGASTGGGYSRWGYHYSGRGAALGSLIGMGVGAALGVAIQKSAENAEMRQYEKYEESEPQREYAPAPSRLPVRISEVTYFDGNGDGYLSKGETIEVETYIENISERTLYSVDIVLDTQKSKYVTVSSPLTITLEPHQKVKYSARIFCRKAKDGRAVPLTIGIASGNETAQSETINIYMR